MDLSSTWGLRFVMLVSGRRFMSCDALTATEGLLKSGEASGAGTVHGGMWELLRNAVVSTMFSASLNARVARSQTRTL